MKKENTFKKLIRWEGKLFWIDLSEWEKGSGDAVVLIIEEDGSVRDATGNDGNFMDIMWEGMTVGDSLPSYVRINR